MDRQARSLSQKRFEVANGLPLVASDPEVHVVLDAHTVREAGYLQIALGKLRRANGHYNGQLLAIDPHRLQSYTQHQTRRHRQDTRTKAFKVLQTFFCLDAQHVADNLFGGLDGAVQVRDDTLVVTYCTAPDVEHLRQHFEHLPTRLAGEGVNPRIPWLDNYQLDFRFA